MNSFIPGPQNFHTVELVLVVVGLPNPIYHLRLGTNGPCFKKRTVAVRESNNTTRIKSGLEPASPRKQAGAQLYYNLLFNIHYDIETYL